MIELGLSEEYLQGFANACQLKEKVKKMNYEGWQCPICKRVYAPFVITCTHCGKEDTSNADNTIYTNTIPKNLDDFDYIKELKKYEQKLTSTNAKFNCPNVKDG